MIAVGATVVVIGGIFALKEYNRKPAGANDGNVEHQVSAQSLFQDFQTDEQAATAKYVGESEQVIEVSGTIREIDPTGEGIQNVILETGDPMAGVVCEFDEKILPATWEAGDDVTVRGFCKGMLMDVLLQRCVAAE